MSLLDHPVQLIVLLSLLSIMPLLVVLGTAFLKLAVVFALLRNALGTQQIPPNIAIYGLSLVLTCFIMAPVAFDIEANLETRPVALSSKNFVADVDASILSPYRAFLTRHTDARQRDFFANIAGETWPEAHRDRLGPDSLLVLMPAFALSQLAEAFKIGLLLYLPFVVIDLVISNILLAMGMMMVSPMTIALPFKLLIFVMMNGWEQLVRQLMLSYA
ncbi:type III secretion system protein SsaR [Pandoraea horticolens]|uniref:Type III secretion system protein SsaR n=1 Tax=Pandoraea horticolens TaxID=2508298 RepID=A0A5E4YKV1_9BURK|nr:type III secretion system export apparatus subunit SctR [Pandoraea horticolens]VVE49040.1 type III secretion system protein SsaR [Pandoraea horticolens]